MADSHLVDNGVVLALLAALLFGISGVVAAGLLEDVDALEIARSRSLITAVLLGLISRKRFRWSTLRPHFGWLVAFGAVLATVTLSFYITIGRLGVGPGVTIQFVGPVLVLAWMTVVQKRSNPSVAWVAAIVAVIGTGLMNEVWSLGQTDPIGILAGVVAAFSFAAYLIVGERLSEALPAVVVVASGFAVSAAIFLAIVPPSFPQITSTAWAQLLWISLAGTTAPFLLELAALRRADPGRVGVVATAEPVIAAAGAWLVLGQSLRWIQIMGGALVVVGIAALQLLTGSIAPDGPDLAI